MSEKFMFWYVRKIFGPLKWYTDRNILGDGGGGVVKNNFLQRFSAAWRCHKLWDKPNQDNTNLGVFRK
jgi:hypothetical protein